MVNVIEINIDKENSQFVLSGAVEAILQNKRLLLSFQRLKFLKDHGRILVPFIQETHINTLQEINNLLLKFGLRGDLSEKAKKDVESFDREQETFTEFSKKARDIRDNKFRENPELVEDFDKFRKVILAKFVRRLYELQLLSAYHMAFAQNACNFAVPGAGKTTIVLAAYTYLKNLPSDNPRHIDKLLVIGPLSSFAPWEQEYEACFGHRPNSQRLSGDSNIARSTKKKHLFSANPAELTLIFHGGVDNLSDEITSFLKKHKTMVVVDEAHRIKNPEGVWGKSIVEIAKEARSRVILTGTPVPNGYEDLYNLYQFIYPYKFKDIIGFHYGNLVEMTKRSEIDDERVLEFIQNIAPYFIRIKKKDLDLPPVRDVVIEVDMNERQREIYDLVEARYIKSFRQDHQATIKDILNRAKLIRLRQAATNPALLIKPIKETLDPDDLESEIIKLPEEFQNDSEILSKICGYARLETPAKFIRIAELLKQEILNSSAKAIIWTIFIQNAKDLQKYLAGLGINSKLLIGEVDQAEREVIISRFNDPDNAEFRVVIANPFCVSESISLHKGCHNAIYLERDYNCASFVQSKDRIHRVGLDKQQITNYFYVLSKDSIDGVIQNKLLAKIERMDRVINDEIPLFVRINDSDETDLIKALLEDYAKRASIV